MFAIILIAVFFPLFIPNGCSLYTLRKLISDRAQKKILESIPPFKNYLG